jgi:hypothetical protein
MKRWLRTFAIVRGLLPFVLAFVRDRRRFILFGSRRKITPEQHLRRAHKLTNTIAGLGPTFVKSHVRQAGAGVQRARRRVARAVSL